MVNLAVAPARQSDRVVAVGHPELILVLLYYGPLLCTLAYGWELFEH
jgi:hypothetical protein